MRKTLLALTLCVVMVSAMAATTAAVAKESGKSPIYQFDVTNGYQGVVCGKIVVNTADMAFVFNGHGLTRGTTYYLYYTTSSGVYSVSSGVSNNGGNVHMAGAWANSVDDVKGTPAPTFVLLDHQLATTTLTITASPSTPSVNEWFLLTITLKADSTGLSMPVKIWLTAPDGKDYVYGTGTYTTNQQGAFLFSQNWQTQGQYVYHAEFAGDIQYGYGASSGSVTVNVQPAKVQPTLYVPTYGYAEANGIITKLYVSGTLTDPNTGAGLAGRTIQWYLSDHVTPITPDGSTIPVTATTDENGNWNIGGTDLSTAIPISHYNIAEGSFPAAIPFYFAGDNSYSEVWATITQFNPTPP